MCLMILYIPPGQAIEEKGLLREMLITPGPLSAAHADLAGQCEKCHQEFFQEKQDGLCVDCHKEIDIDLLTGHGLHGSTKKKTVSLSCAECHSEHLGNNEPITLFDPELFSHQRSGFELTGRHGQLECKSCHNNEQQKKNEFKGKYRIDETDCGDCHKSPHRLSLKAAASADSLFQKGCDNCHNSQSWKAEAFKHDESGFPLTGKHREVLCQACHTDLEFRAPNQCSDCHSLADRHQGALGNQCDECHKTNKWSKGEYNHQDTRFPLKDAHRRLTCETCHFDALKNFDHLFIGEKRKKNICAQCHEGDDLHDNTFGDECQNCHGESQWENARFDHNRLTDFSIEGRHNEAACHACHLPGDDVHETAGSLKDRKDCIDCHVHQDPHKGKQKECTRCHSVYESWDKTPSFDHEFTRFPILGSHGLLNCESCHMDRTYSAAKVECESCHTSETSHRGVFTSVCETCHNSTLWQNWNFDHDTGTDYPLEGAHRQTGCWNCHNNRHANPSAPGKTCMTCHQQDDIHNRSFGSQCGRCHTLNSFREIRP